MARLYESGAELQSTTNGMEWATTTVTGGGVTINTTTKRSGSASIKFTSSASASNYIEHKYSASEVVTYSRFYLYFTAWPTDASGAIIQHLNSTTTVIASIVLTTAGKLQLFDGSSAGTQRGSDSAALSLNTWYRVELSTNNGAGTELDARINGTSFATGAMTSATNAMYFDVGFPDWQANSVMYVDDIAINDSSGTSETSWPGSGKLVLALPTAAGDNAATTGIYSYINEIPPTDTATTGVTMVELDTNATIADYNMTDSSTLAIPSDATIKYVSVWARIREEAAGTSNYTLRVKSRAGGTTSSSSSQDAGNATARTNPSGTTAFSVRHVAYKIPQDGTTAWTATGTDSIDAMQVGVATTDGNPDIWCLWLGAYIEYNPVNVSQTEAAFYEDGTEAGSTVIDSGADSITRDVSSDSNILLRVRLQENNGAAGASTDDYQLQYELNDSGTYYNAGSGTVATYYFDGSDAAATDPDSAWTNDSEAFNGDIITPATAPGIAGASNSTKFLKAEGTNAPGSGGVISQVRARMYASNVAPDGHTHSAEIYTDALGESLGVITKNTGAEGYGSYGTLSTPTGGWTWAKLQALEVKIWANDAGAGAPGVHLVEIEVTTSAPITNFASTNLTDGNATTNRLGSGTGSFVAGEISEDGLVDNHQLTASNYTEHLYALTIVSSAVANADTLDFRVLRNSAVIDTYTVVPRITVSKSSNVTATPTTLALTTALFAPTVTASDHKSATPTTLALTTATFAPTVSVSDNQSVTPTTLAIVTALFAPTVSVTEHQTATPSTLAIVITAYEPTVTATDHKTVTPDTLSLTTSLFAPTVTASDHQSVTPTTVALTTTAFEPGVVIGTVVTPAIVELLLTTFAPTISVSDNQSVTPTTASLTTTGNAPTVSVSDNKSATPDVVSLVITTFAPTVVIGINVTPDTLSLAITTFAPTISVSDNQSVTPTTLALTTSTFAPTVTASDHKSVTPSIAELVLATFAPTIVLGTVASPGIAELVIATFAPTVTATDHKTATPTTASLITSLFAPTVSVSDNQSATPTTASLSLSTFAPTVSLSDNISVTPTTLSLVTSAFAPTVTASNSNFTVTPTNAALTLTTYAPTVRTTIYPRDYYIDTDGNVFWVLNQTAGLVEQI